MMFSHMDFAFAFDHFILNLDEYSIDIPNLNEILPLFLSRAIYDEVLPRSYILYGEAFS